MSILNDEQNMDHGIPKMKFGPVLTWLYNSSWVNTYLFWTNKNLVPKMVLFKQVSVYAIF